MLIIKQYLNCLALVTLSILWGFNRSLAGINKTTVTLLMLKEVCRRNLIETGTKKHITKKF